MPRPRRDGAPAAAPNKHKLNELINKRLKPQAGAFVVWDDYARVQNIARCESIGSRARVRYPGIIAQILLLAA
jgi:hypothetical protein